MSSKILWKKLNDLANSGEDNREEQACQLLAEAYKENDHMIVSCVFQRINGQLYANQTYLPLGPRRLLVCYTSEKKARNDHWQIKTGWDEIPVRNVLNNMFNKDVIAGLIFNPHDDNPIMIFKTDMEKLLPGNHPKPAGYREPGK